MSLTGIMERQVVTAAANETVRSAARRMAENNVGTAVVVGEGVTDPVGFITDRDLTVRCLAKGLDPDLTRLSDVMSRPVHLVFEHVPLEQALSRMAEKGTRRLVVTGENNRIVGILSLDKVLELLAAEAEAVGRILAAQEPYVDRAAVVAAAPAAVR